jgi:hypothetical protein
MRTLRNAILVAVVLGVVCFVLQTNTSTLAQGTKLPKPIQIQANAMGTSTQMGRQFHINVYINALSSADDQKALLEAFQAKGNEGLVNAVSKMSGKGRIAIVGTLGYDVNYVRRFNKPDGSIVLRMVTDRPITFGENWHDTRSRDYSLSALEITFSADRKKNEGVLLPACEFKINKQNHLEIEAYQNPWKLTNIMRRR